MCVTASEVGWKQAFLMPMVMLFNQWSFCIKTNIAIKGQFNPILKLHLDMIDQANHLDRVEEVISRFS